MFLGSVGGDLIAEQTEVIGTDGAVAEIMHREIAKDRDRDAFG